MSGPTLNLGTIPPRDLFKFPPDSAPPAIIPPFEGYSFKTPFPIPTEIYNAALDPRVPITIATTYAITVSLTNAYNRRHKNQPWRISKTRLFKAFVILHNVGLAIYSAVTCVAMVRALKHAIPHYTEENALVGTVDALCKMHGPRGLGDAITFNPNNAAWEAKNRLIKLGAGGIPDSSDVGRVWNEGLAFWGWVFYLSKFYEVLDTFIILAKGKRSTTLQTYHHSGAMLCMWAGIRYMSPPIWMFALVNSGIHAMMYTYYTVSALGVRVPQAIKRSLTSMQILQFLVGATFAGLHLFVSYSVPVSVPFVTKESVKAVTSSVASAISSATESSAVASTTAAAAAALLKKLVYRAAGEEGLAENVGQQQPMAAAAQAAAPIEAVLQEPILSNAAKNIVYRTEYQEVPCIDTTGQSFAIWLNLIYLFPLTFLFVRFFVKSYILSKQPRRSRRFSKAGQDAVHGVSREIESLGKAAEDGVVNGKVKGRGRTPKKGVERVSSLSPAERREKVVSEFNKKLNEGLEKANLSPKGIKTEARETAKEVISRASTPRGKRTNDGIMTPESNPDKRSLAERLNDVRDGLAKETKENDEIVGEAHIEPLKEGESKSVNGGLSTDDPKQKGVAYADMVKKE